LASLNDEAVRDGFLFVERLMKDWLSGLNRFSQPGERLVGATRDGKLLGVCGLNRDPYVIESRIGRLRHLYVKRSERNQGLGSALVEYLLRDEGAAFAMVRLRTENLQPRCFANDAASIGSVRITRHTRKRFDFSARLILPDGRFAASSG
jgi:GNAT superfamily N-acetyltransferase